MLTKAKLRELYRVPSERSLGKEIRKLEGHSRLFISRSPLIVISTHDGEGRCDCSPRGGLPGFVCILNDSQIAIPDFRGNNRLESLENIIQTGRIGCVFMVPGISETLRLNGSASIHSDSDIIDQFDCADVVRTFILVDVEEVYVHCGKSLIRSSVWDASTHVSPQDFPSLGTILNSHVGKAVMPESHAEVDAIYSQTMAEQVRDGQSTNSIAQKPPIQNQP